MKQNLLLIEDVEELGRSGEIVSVKPGYARNFLLPKKKAFIATSHAMRMQKKLQEERAKKAIVDRGEAEELAKVIEKFNLEKHVKVDPEGKMYGSVSSQDIVHLLEEKGIKLEKRNVLLKSPIKETGTFEVSFRLKEGVVVVCKVEIIPEGGKLALKPTRKKETKPAEIEEQEPTEEKEETK
jgi:large subunit ribosomal protein L9